MVGGTHPYVKVREYTLGIPSNNQETIAQSVPHISQKLPRFWNSRTKENHIQMWNFLNFYYSLPFSLKFFLKKKKKVREDLFP